MPKSEAWNLERRKAIKNNHLGLAALIIIMYIYDAPINALSAHIIHINLNTIFYTHVEDSPTKTIDITYYMQTRIHTQ